MAKILIAITTAETVYHETMESIFNLQRTEDMQVGLKVIHSYDVANGRTELVHIAQANKVDYIFFVDSDVILPRGALIKLIQANKDVALGTYPRKDDKTFLSDNPYTTLYRHSEKNKECFCPYWLPQNELPKEGVIPVDCGGLGCALIKMSVFETIKAPWFVFVKENANLAEGAYCIGEDMYFFRECLKYNIQPYAEGSVRCGHIGKCVYTLKPDVPNQVPNVI